MIIERATETISTKSPINWPSLAAQFEILKAQPITVYTAADWLKRWSDLQKIVWEVRANLKRTRLRDVTNENANQAWQTFYETFFTPFLEANQALTQKLLALINSSGDPNDFYFVLPPEIKHSLRLMQAESTLYQPDNLALFAEINRLIVAYETKAGSILVEIDGQVVTRGELENRMASPDREIRKKTFEAQNTAWKQARQHLNDLFLQIVQFRRKIAHQAGQSDYRAYRWQEMGRLDYTPEESLGFHEAVRRLIVPMAQKMIARQAAENHLDLISPWDQIFIQKFPGGPQRPIADTAAFEDAMGSIFHQIDPELGNLYENMRAEFLDLGSRPGKPQGGEEWLFPYSGMPCVRADADGSIEGITLLLHEMGHAFHDYLVMKDHGLFWLLDYPSEFSELASIAMTYLASPYLSTVRGGFFTPEDTLAFQQKIINEVIVRWLPQIALVDRFQHWLYAEAPETLTALDLDQQWTYLSSIFMPWIDWMGSEEDLKFGWQRVGILFSQPFYQIEYGLANLGALQIWEQAQQDWNSAWMKYRQALTMGSTCTLAQLYETAGAILPFDQNAISRVMRSIQYLIS